MPKRTQTEIMDLLKGDSKLNRARREFANYSGKIEQGGQQRVPLGPIEMRGLEFECVEAILAIYGVKPTEETRLDTGGMLRLGEYP